MSAPRGRQHSAAAAAAAAARLHERRGLPPHPQITCPQAAPPHYARTPRRPPANPSRLPPSALRPREPPWRLESRRPTCEPAPATRLRPRSTGRAHRRGRRGRLVCPGAPVPTGQVPGAPRRPLRTDPSHFPSDACYRITSQKELRADMLPQRTAVRYVITKHQKYVV
jgi:hypothetical protein